MQIPTQIVHLSIKQNPPLNICFAGNLIKYFTSQMYEFSFKPLFGRLKRI